MPRPFRALCVFSFVLLCGAMTLGEARAQSLPIPGLPGGLGGVSTPETEPAAPDTAPPQDPPPDAAQSPSAAVQDPTRALIDILRDDQAREALIRELEAASAGRAPGAAPDAAAPGSPPPADGAPAAPPAAGAPDAAGAPVQQPAAETFADRAVAATRRIGEAVYVEMERGWLRIKRVPNTFRLSTRIFENGALERALAEIVWLAVFLYGALIVLRLIFTPIRRGFVRFARKGQWTRTLIMRILASALDLLKLPLAAIAGVTAFVLSGFAYPGLDGTTEVTDQQALFVNAFVTIQTALVVVGFVLSANTPELRILRLPDRAARSLWFLACGVIYVLGYSQLLFVPLISEGVSLFVGRAAAAVVSAAVVAVLILYVLAIRRRVADWLSEQGSGSAVYQLALPLLVRWHWPVLVYLVYLFINVLTRPGNVLLPLLRTTGEVLLVVIVASMVLTALNARAAMRVRIPQPIAERLPLLEERINQLRPGFMGIVRFLVLVVSLIVLLNLLGIQGIGGFLSGAVLQQLSSGLLSVLLVTGLLALVWLAMTSWVDYRLNPFVGTVPTSREVTLLTLMKNAVTVAIIIIGIIMSLAQLGMNVGPLIASAGVIGLAISFGAQRMVEDIFSGIFIQAENAMNVGDVVDVGGTVGTVEKLTVRSVTLRDLSGVVHVIPFSSAAKISNFMRDYAYHVADIGVAYREAIEDVRVAMHDAFERLCTDPELAPDVIGDLEWFGLNAFGPSELVVRARIKTVPGKQWAIGRAYNGIVKQSLDERGIEIPFPHQTVYFGEDKGGKAPPLHLQVERPRRGRAAREEERGAARDDRVHGADHPEAEASDTDAAPRDALLPDDRIRGADIPDGDGR